MKSHCILAVLSLMAPGLSFACGGVGAENHLNILGIGNSWTRDSFRYIYGIAESAGADVTVAHGYLGGSTLEDQFFGIDDETYSYNHNGVGVTLESILRDRDWDIIIFQPSLSFMARSMGRKCDYYVNVGRAVHIARSNPLFDNCGYKLQRKQDNTHLAEGVAKYAASLMFAYQVLGVKPFQITYCPSTYDFTPELAAAARASSWKAAKCR